MRYADPSVCPDCRAALPHGTPSCPSCSLPVRHPLAAELFATLRRADDLVGRLRALADAPVAAPTPPAGAAAAPPPAPPRPAPLPAQPARGLRLASVPKILLGLGALCLLVAAVIFLAVSWSWLGVGGRTAVLVALTVGTGAAALLLNRGRLRVAGEALVVVALGLLALDVLGADSAGWLGDLSEAGLAVVLGAVLALAGTACALPDPVRSTRLVAPQVVAALGYLVAYLGVVEASDRGLLVGNLAVAVGVAVAWSTRRVLPVQAWSYGVAAALVWVVTGLGGLVVAVDEPSFEAIWLDHRPGWSLLATAAALLAPGVLLRRRDVLVPGAAGAAVVATVALTLPAVDTSARTFGVVALLVTAAWVAAYRLLPDAYRDVAVGAAGLGSLVLAGTSAVTGAVAAARSVTVGAPYSAAADVAVTGPEPLTEPLLAAPSVAVVVAFAALLARGRGRGRLHGGTVAVGVAAVATLASYDVPLAAVLAAGALLAVGTLVVALLEPARQTALGVVGLAGAAVVACLALPSAWLSAGAALVAVAVAAVAHVVPRSGVLRALGGVALAPSAGLLVWSGLAGAGVDVAWRGVPVLVVVGLLALARPRPQVELPALGAALVGLPAAVLGAADGGGSLALHLTVLGCLLAATALLHESRRPVAWAGGAVLLLATWVRLGDLGVTAPEPYTLPLATALAVIGLWRLHHDPASDTATALGPGLVLATVPSLFWALDDPISMRALVLGAACLALAIAGAALRWSAPLVTGSVVGAVLVVREVGPYAAEVPQWVWIGLAGALLVTVGITWERRLLELREAVGLLGRLR